MLSNACATRLSRLMAECGEELPLGADYGMAVVTPADIAQALLDCDQSMEDDDAEYCRAIVAGERGDDEPA